MASSFQPLPGFRDFAPRENLASLYLFEAWTAVARRYGFAACDAPILEPAELYLKKSGGELSTQLFRFTDQGDRDVVLRPELTASLARIAAARQRDYTKPMKWFSVGRFFRYEKPQRGRLREFFQFNADIFGEASPAADAEQIALAIDVMRELGFTRDDFVVRLSDRTVWQSFAQQHGIDDLDAFLAVIDKIERDPPEKLGERLAPFGVSLEKVQDFISDPASKSQDLEAIEEDLRARGLAGFVETDLSVVRGLAYYTGVVFEVFDAGKSLRSVAGGGRYDSLVSVLSDGSADLPATGFAMGDCVIMELINETPGALARMTAWRQRQSTCDVYVVIADEARRPEALALAGKLREAGVATDLPLTPTKMNRQFKNADQSLARLALVVGSEFPELKLKILASRTEESIPPNSDPVESIRRRLDQPDGPLLA
jgi:histidyl-tRNA synthetase